MTNPPSRIRATFGAKAADLSAQIDAQQIAESPFQAGDLVTVLVGANDVLEQYAQYPAVSEPVLTANVKAAGVEAGSQVNRLADLGAKVIVSTIPDVGFSPFAVTEKAAHADTDRQAMIIRLTAAFNASLRATIVNDGRRIGLVLMDELVQAVAKFPGVDGFTNTTAGACDLSQSMLTPPSILDCTDLTLIPGATSTSYLWADDRHLSYGGQLRLGNLAASARQEQPVLSGRGRRAQGRGRRAKKRPAPRRRRPIRRALRAPAAPRWRSVVDDGDDDVAPARIAEHVAGDADDVAQRPGLEMGAARACLRAAQRAVDAGDRQRAHQLGHHRARPGGLEQAAEGAAR